MPESTESRQSRAERRFAAHYDRMNAAVERRWAGELRDHLVADLTGQVLDLGAGTGAALSHFRAAAKVTAAEPSAAMRERLAARLGEAQVPVEVEVVDAVAEELPFPDDHFDAVVCALVLCTVPDPPRALAEIHRVLKPTGRLVFLEHVRATGPASRAQDLITPLIKHFGAGCHPNRDTVATIADAGFTFRELDTFKPWPRLPLFAPFAAGSATPTDASNAAM